MHITKYYKYNEDEIVKVSGNLPENVVVLEEMDILYAEDGYELVRISTNENVSDCIWLHNNDVSENYKEIKIEEEE
jgi:hypothetical protein